MGELRSLVSKNRRFGMIKATGAGTKRMTQTGVILLKKVVLVITCAVVKTGVILVNHIGNSPSIKKKERLTFINSVDSLIVNFVKHFIFNTVS